MICGGQEKRQPYYIVMQRKESGHTKTVPVPDHSVIRKGTLQSIIRQSGLPRNDFET